MATTSGLESHILLTALNTTVNHVYLNTTLLPPKSTAMPFKRQTNWQHNATGSLPAIQNGSGHWNNNTGSKPNCFNCSQPPITMGPLLITYTYSYSYDYAYYAFLLILLMAALICIKIGISRRKEVERQAAAQRARARQQTHRAESNDNSNNSNNPNVLAKEFDLPPAYNEVVQSYILNNQSPQNATTDVPNGVATSSTASIISTSVSTLTIESEIPSSNHASASSLNTITIVQ